MGLTGCPQTLCNYHHTLRNIPKQRRAHVPLVRHGVHANWHKQQTLQRQPKFRHIQVSALCRFRRYTTRIKIKMQSNASPR